MDTERKQRSKVSVNTMFAKLHGDQLVSDGTYSPSITAHFSRHDRTEVRANLLKNHTDTYRVTLNSGPYPEDADVTVFLSQAQLVALKKAAQAALET